MSRTIDDLVTSYERGKLTRRQLLAALAVVAGSGTAAAQAPTPGLVRPKSLDHISIRVSDLARSEAFYRKVFGFPPFRPLAGNQWGFDLPSGSYLSFNKSDPPGVVDHICVGLEDEVDIKKVLADLDAAGMKASAAGGLLIDPDGLRVQLAKR